MADTVTESMNHKSDQHFPHTSEPLFHDADEIPRSRPELESYLRDRCARDAEFRQYLIQNPREVGAIAVEVCFGIPQSVFLDQVKSVQVIQEDQQSLGIVLPACHYGCTRQRPEYGLPSDSAVCSICDAKGAMNACSNNTDQQIVTRSLLRSSLQHRAMRNQRFRVKLMSCPVSTLSEVLTDWGVEECHPLRRIYRVSIVPETSELTGFVLFAEDHDPRKHN